MDTEEVARNGARAGKLLRHTANLQAQRTLWRHDADGSTVEASKIAGHANTKITLEYAIVQLKTAGGTHAPDSMQARGLGEEGQG